jgi:hypothetical protein
MNNARKRSTFFVVVLLIGILFFSGYLIIKKQQIFGLNSLNVDPSKIQTWDCEYPAYKPETIMIYCGDGGAYISKIKWNSWGQNGAAGIGEYYRNLCEPDCADGQIAHAPVRVSLSDLTQQKGKYYLRTLDMSSANGKDFAWGESGTFHWNVMDFAEQMNS